MNKSKKTGKRSRGGKKTARKGLVSDEIGHHHDSSAKTVVIADPWAQLRWVTLELLLLAAAFAG